MIFKFQVRHNNKYPFYHYLFKEFDNEKLVVIAKQVFISPIQNFRLFMILKKRLETAHQINDDLKEIMKEQ